LGKIRVSRLQKCSLAWVHFQLKKKRGVNYWGLNKTGRTLCKRSWWGGGGEGVRVATRNLKAKRWKIKYKHIL